MNQKFDNPFENPRMWLYQKALNGINVYLSGIPQNEYDALSKEGMEDFLNKFPLESPKTADDFAKYFEQTIRVWLSAYDQGTLGDYNEEKAAICHDPDICIPCHIGLPKHLPLFMQYLYSIQKADEQGVFTSDEIMGGLETLDQQDKEKFFYELRLVFLESISEGGESYKKYKKMRDEGPEKYYLPLLNYYDNYGFKEEEKGREEELQRQNIEQYTHLVELAKKGLPNDSGSYVDEDYVVDLEILEEAAVEKFKIAFDQLKLMRDLILKGQDQEIQRKEIIEIHKDPSLDEIWDLCIRNFLYNNEKYVNEILTLFERIGITKESKIADVSAGGGFPALNLIELGYKVDCFDGFASDLFNKNAKEQGQNTSCKEVLWQDLPEVAPQEQYDFIFCRGNSFIFAGGGWTELTSFDTEKVRAEYGKTAKIFADMLKSGGYMYIDKFKDSEIGHREKLATIKIGEQAEDLMFSSKRSPEAKTRQAFMQRMVGDVVVNSETRVTYDLLSDELIKFLKDSGFSDIEQINKGVPEEKHFDVWLAKKQ